MKKFLYLSLVLIMAAAGCGKSGTGSPVYYTPSPQEAPRGAATLITDTLLEIEIKSKMISDDLVESKGIEVDVRHSVVFLKGTAINDSQRRIAADLARGIEGVVRVENQIKIKPFGH